MKKLNLLSAILVLNTTLFAQIKWNVDKTHAKIGFMATHMMLSDVDGNFRKFDASVIASKDDFTDAIFDITIDAASVNTDNEMRDNILKSDYFFNAAKYPQITFKSTSIKKLDAKKYKVIGNLTMNGVIKQETFDLLLRGVGNEIMTHKPVVGFNVTGTINRNDFGIGKSAPATMVSEEIELRVSGEFAQE